MTAPHESIERLRAALAEQYEVERLLGQGGMGAVFRGFNRVNGCSRSIGAGPEMISGVRASSTRIESTSSTMQYQ
jgi:hypothetical protein